ncbi:hypothetical protein L9F63_023144, partial [Diploptera punctata]
YTMFGDPKGGCTGLRSQIAQCHQRYHHHRVHKVYDIYHAQALNKNYVNSVRRRGHNSSTSQIY